MRVRLRQVLWTGIFIRDKNRTLLNVIFQSPETKRIQICFKTRQTATKA